MEHKPYFTETQQFNQWWIWILLIPVNLLVFWGIYQQIIKGVQWGNKPMSDSGLILTSAITLLLPLFLYASKLSTKINSEGIYIRFFPFHLKSRFYPWQSIDRSYVRTYSPITEFGGWGIRMGFFGKGKAFNVSGDQGLQLEFKTGKKLLIGTNEAEELERVLKINGHLK